MSADVYSLIYVEELTLLLQEWQYTLLQMQQKMQEVAK